MSSLNDIDDWVCKKIRDESVLINEIYSLTANINNIKNHRRLKLIKSDLVLFSSTYKAMLSNISDKKNKIKSNPAASETNKKLDELRDVSRANLSKIEDLTGIVSDLLKRKN